MRAADYVAETTTSIAGTSGNGAITLTAVTNVPRHSTVFGTTKRWVRYVIEDTVGKKFESGIGYFTSNVLTRDKPQITWDGTTWSDNAPAALQFGSSPTSGNVIVRMASTAEDRAPNIHARQTTIAGDASWRDYWISQGLLVNSGGAGIALTADRENYSTYKLETAGRLTGWQFQVTTAQAGSNLKAALYDCGSNGLPGVKICDFVTTVTASTGVKTDTATGSWSPAGPIWLTPGWYYIGYISGHAIALNGMAGSGRVYANPVGKQSFYGNGDTVYIAGSYATGLPSEPSLGSGTMAGPSTFSALWLALRVEP